MNTKIKYVALFLGIATVGYAGFSFYVHKERERLDNKRTSYSKAVSIINNVK